MKPFHTVLSLQALVQGLFKELLSCPWVPIAGVVRSVKETLSSQFVESCKGVVQRLTLQEHKMVWNRTTHLWYVPGTLKHLGCPRGGSWHPGMASGMIRVTRCLRAGSQHSPHSDSCRNGMCLANLKAFTERLEEKSTQHRLNIDQSHLVTELARGWHFQKNPTCRTEINWIWVIPAPREPKEGPRTAEMEPSGAV